MARYKAIDTSPRFLAGDLERQLLPAAFLIDVRQEPIGDIRIRIWSRKLVGKASILLTQ